VTELTILLPLVGFVALAALTTIVLRRAGSIMATTREAEGFRLAIRDLAARVETSLDGASGQIDAVRRGQVPADSIGPTVEAATEAVARYTDEARAINGPERAVEIRDDIIAELERASRALEMVAHGATILAQVRRRGRELEAQTSLKRGYLNLLHAREAVARHAARLEDLKVRVEPGGRNAVVTVPETRSDHTM
jgi:hypothetical protein